MTLKNWVRRLQLEGVARLLLLEALRVVLAIFGERGLSSDRIPRRFLIDAGNAALARGRHRLAKQAYVAALARGPEDGLLRLQIGVTAFLAGHYDECEKWFASLDQSKHFDRERFGLERSEFRVLDRTWLLAIGHLAFIDTYVKSMQLGWTAKATTLLAYSPTRPPAGWPMLKYFGDHVTILADPAPEEAIDKRIHGAGVKRIDGHTRDLMRVALSRPFWYGRDEQGRTRWYGPLGAAVENAWKAGGRPPLCAPSLEERARFRHTMSDVFGLPENAWFVVLHVREPGYHARWHRHHPGTRNADIRSYDKVIDFVLAQGGWVVRGGDPTMVPISPRDGVIDYATSPFRSPEIDILICAEAKYFIGTNSGFSLVPPIFGVRCALTNWSPVGIPNWYPSDLFIPKLVRRKSDGRYLSFEEMFSGIAGWSQFQRDYDKAGLVVEDNSPEDLLDAVAELHGEIEGTAPPASDHDLERVRRFENIALRHGSYCGSRIGHRFLERHEALLG